MGSTGGPQSRALKRKEREAPQDSPRARKKVMRAPATSLSCGSTCLEHTETEAYLEKARPDLRDSFWALCCASALGL